MTTTTDTPETKKILEELHSIYQSGVFFIEVGRVVETTGIGRNTVVTTFGDLYRTNRWRDYGREVILDGETYRKPLK